MKPERKFKKGSLARAVAMAAMLMSACEAMLAAPGLSTVGEYLLPRSFPEGLSGITWLGGEKYALIEDSGGIVHYMKIFVDTDSGAVTNVAMIGRRHAAGIVDGEGIAFDKAEKRLFISDETGPKIASVDFMCKGRPDFLQVPSDFRRMRENKALEALAFDSKSRMLWTAAEDAMEGDGEISSTTNEAVTRVFAFDLSNGVTNAPAVYKYKIDKAFGRMPFSRLPSPFSGLVAMAAVSPDLLLVLERSCGFVEKGEVADCGEGLITLSLFAVDPSVCRPGEMLEKRLLWRHVSQASNYEGMTLGPELADGSRLLLLVADGDKTASGHLSFRWTKSLFSLRLKNAK